MIKNFELGSKLVNLFQKKKAIINFRDRDEFNSYIASLELENIDEGYEGVCYKGNDGYSYKILEKDYVTCGREFVVNDIILDKEVGIDSFLLPLELYVVDGKLYGYKTRFIENNIFMRKKADIEKIFNIDFDKFIKAYYKLYEDVIAISEKNIEINDLALNLIFDGEALYCIDTCCYKRKNVETLGHNLRELNEAITVIFAHYFDDFSLLNGFNGSNIESYISNVVMPFVENNKALIR